MSTRTDSRDQIMEIRKIKLSRSRALESRNVRRKQMKDDEVTK